MILPVGEEGEGGVPRKLVSSEQSDGVSGNGEGGLEVCDEGGGVGKHERGAYVWK